MIFLDPSIRELAEDVRAQLRFSGAVVFDTTKLDGVPVKVLDVQKMRSVLDWAPCTSLSDGLVQTVRWYLANKEEADARV